MPRIILCCVALLLSMTALPPGSTRAAGDVQKPNVVILFADDLGYGDLGCFGHPTIRTPNLDRMAAEGQKWTQFYAAASVCTPSRAGLMTGRLPIRSGMCGNRRVLFPDSIGGLPDEEITLAEALKAQGYATACVGKWHLGHLPQYLPTSNGFDSYFGVPYSNDMRMWDDKAKMAPLMRNEEVIEVPADQTTLTRRYTAEAVEFIRTNKDRPFFLYMPHTFPHVPLYRSKEFTDTSLRGLYGDVVEELDWSVGRVLDTLRQLEIDERTMVVFTSDNGPWLIMKLNGGSAGLLREGKGCTYEGGMREPTIFWWPGRIPAGTVVADLGSTLDLFVTASKLAGAPVPDDRVPNDRVIDGVDLSPALFGTGKSPRTTMFFYRNLELFAVRKGPYKAHFITQPAYGPGGKVAHDPPELYHLEHDPSEQFNVADQHPDVVADLIREVQRHRETLQPVPSQLDLRPE